MYEFAGVLQSMETDSRRTCTFPKTRASLFLKQAEIRVSSQTLGTVRDYADPPV